MTPEQHEIMREALAHFIKHLSVVSEDARLSLSDAQGLELVRRREVEAARATLIAAENAHAEAQRVVTTREACWRRLEQDKSQALWLLREEGGE